MMARVSVVFWLSVLVAAGVPLWPDGKVAAPTQAGEFAWPRALVAAEWREQPLAEREARFAREFPGRIGVFATPDGRTVVVRQVLRPTRKLHPAADCLRAVGYDIEARPLFSAADGVEWGACEATREGERVQVRERLEGADGRRWTDVSAWFWSATLGGAGGPWWALTELTSLPSEGDTAR